MFVRASLAVSVMLLAACAPEQKAPEAPVTPEAVEPQMSDDIATSDAAKYKPAPEGEINVTGPASGARVSSPLIAEGTAINTWFFEGQFVAELVADGEVLVQAPAMQAGDTKCLVGKVDACYKRTALSHALRENAATAADT